MAEPSVRNVRTDAGAKFGQDAPAPRGAARGTRTPKPPVDSSRERPAVTAKARGERVCRVHEMNLWTEVLPTGSLGGAIVGLLMAGERWLRRKRFARRVVRDLATPGGPEYGSLGWMWNELTRIAGETSEVQRREIEKARSKAHSAEAWCAQLAERCASLETAVFGQSRLQSGEQERIDVARERRAPADDATTEPDPLPPMLDEAPRPRRLPSPGTGRRSRQG